MWRMRLSVHYLSAWSITFCLLGFGNLQHRLTNSVKQSLKRALLLQEILDKTTNKVVKRVKYRKSEILKRKVTKSVLKQTMGS